MRTVQLSLSLPLTDEILPLVARLRQNVSTLFQVYDSPSSSFTSSQSDTSRSQMRRFKRFMRGSKLFPFIIVGIIILALLGFGLKTVLTKSAVTSTNANGDGRVELRKPLATENIKKDFSFPLKDAAGKQISSIKLTLQTLELRDQIIIQGKVANTTVGKNVLVANIDLTNNYTKPVQINSRNYFRLKKNNDGKLYDPKIHNDPLDVQPVSTTNTRIGFTVDDTDKDFFLRIGDVTDPDAKIQEIKINLR